MMLKLKNWQLFTVTWLPFLVVIIYGERVYSEILKPIAFSMFYFGLLRWFWEICVNIPDKIMLGTNWRNPSKKYFIVPIIYFSIIILGSSTTIFHRFAGVDKNLSFFEISMIILFVVTALNLIQLFRLAAKLVYKIDRSIPKMDEVHILLLFIFSFIGIWLIQPKINKVVTG